VSRSPCGERYRCRWASTEGETRTRRGKRQRRAARREQSKRSGDQSRPSGGSV
jgi:hypothetical protein